MKDARTELRDSVVVLDNFDPKAYENAEPPLVSIYLPIHRTEREDRRDEWDKIEFKDLKEEAERTLREKFPKEEDWAGIAERLNYLLEKFSKDSSVTDLNEFLNSAKAPKEEPKPAEKKAEKKPEKKTEKKPEAPKAEEKPAQKPAEKKPEQKAQPAAQQNQQVVQRPLVQILVLRRGDGRTFADGHGAVEALLAVNADQGRKILCLDLETVLRLRKIQGNGRFPRKRQHHVPGLRLPFAGNRLSAECGGFGVRTVCSPCADLIGKRGLFPVFQLFDRNGHIALRRVQP